MNVVELTRAKEELDFFPLSAFQLLTSTGLCYFLTRHVFLASVFSTNGNTHKNRAIDRSITPC